MARARGGMCREVCNLVCQLRASRTLLVLQSHYHGTSTMEADGPTIADIGVDRYQI